MKILLAYWSRYWHCLYFGITKIMTEDHRLVNKYCCGKNFASDKIIHIGCACGKVFYERPWLDAYNEIYKTNYKAQ